MTRIVEIKTPLRLVVTVDTEADNAWSQPDKVNVTNIRELERFQDLCETYGVVPTYLLAYECATRDEALSVIEPLSRLRHCEIGHHLHVWTTPPFQNEGRSGVDLDWIHAYQFQLPDSLFLEKAETLRQAIERNVGKAPTAHRAGRWGIDQRTVDWLADAGFIVETSMRTGLRLRNLGDRAEQQTGTGRTAACTKYELHRNAYAWPSSRTLSRPPVIEIPATVDVPNDLISQLYLRFLSLQPPREALFFRAYKKLAGLSMLYPDPAQPSGHLPRVIERALGRGATIINLVLHSSELALHCSPFTKSADDLEKVWRHLEDAFRYCRDRRVVSEGISDVALLARQNAPSI